MNYRVAFMKAPCGEANREHSHRNSALALYSMYGFTAVERVEHELSKDHDLVSEMT